MRTRQLTVKGLPAGWRVLQMARSTQHPMDSYILCERDPPRKDDMNFVTWYANLEMGGCVHGNYFDSLRDAEADFNRRKASLR